LPERKAGFAKTDRLLTPEDYSWVFRRPVKSADDCFTVMSRSRGGGSARLGLAVSKKNVRRAVDRNRIKRVIRESFRHNRLALEGLDIVVLGRRGIEQHTNRILVDSLSRHWKTISETHVSHPKD
jgi:ribonuclease P protein component